MGDETAALLRILIYKIDNTTFGNDTPVLPQWTGPPHTIVQVQAILYASLAISLLSAFFAMLGKQWLNRYASTDIRGTTIERSQNRQRKLDGVVTWYFNHVMESLPLMLQGALLLLGCALSRYLWGIHITVASVILCVTMTGVILYIFVVVAGAASKSCPYQTPGSHALCYIGLKVQSVLHIVAPAVVSAPSIVASAFRDVSSGSETVEVIKTNAWEYHPWWSTRNFVPFLKDVVCEIPRALANDVYNLLRATIRKLAAFLAGSYHLGSAVVGSLVDVTRNVLIRSHSVSPTPEQISDQRTIVLDLRCISWMLRTSLDKAVLLSTLKHLVSMAVLANFDPSLVADCFGIFIGCINVSNRKVVVIQGLEELATVSAMCFLRTFNHLLVVDPTSSVLADLRQRYNRVLPFRTNFWGLPFYYTMAKIHGLVNQTWDPRHVRWDNYKPSTQEHIPVAQHMVEAAQVEYQKTQHRKVPRWILRFTFCSLSLDSPPPIPVVTDCLSIIAIDLGCDMSDTEFTTSDERCVHISQVIVALTSNQCTRGAYREPYSSETQNNGRSRRFPSAPIQAQGDHHTPPLRSLAGAKWETRDARHNPTGCQSLEDVEVHVVSRHPIRWHVTLQSKPPSRRTCIASHRLGLADR